MPPERERKGPIEWPRSHGNRQVTVRPSVSPSPEAVTGTETFQTENGTLVELTSDRHISGCDLAMPYTLPHQYVVDLPAAGIS